MNGQAISRWDYQVRLLAWVATFVGVYSFMFYLRRGDVLLYGDAVAHINIARRIFDSKTPGLLQLGTVWLPLPHLLMIPFLISDKLWRTGAGGSFPSLAAYVLGVIGVFRLTRALLPSKDVRTDNVRTDNVRTKNPRRQPASTPKAPDYASVLAPWIAAGIYAANPNLIYLQTTAMGEALYLALFAWSVAYFSEFLHGDSKALTKCGLCLAAASLTRYDGWFLAAATVAMAVAAAFAIRNSQRDDRGERESTLNISRANLLRFLVISAAAPALWLAYNAAVYRNPLEFANGPFSAKSIERQTGTVNPAKGNLYAAGSYFLKSAELNVAEKPSLGRLWLGLAAAGFVITLATAQNAWPTLLLWTPLPFYALSLAYGSVPIFVPPWWPFSQYNVRYGLELLPAFAVSLASLAHFLVRKVDQKGDGQRKIFRMAALAAIIAVVIAGYSSVWIADPICYREAATNMRGRVALEGQLAKWLTALPPQSTLLMYLGEHPGAVEQAGIPLRRVINEGNHRVWKQPSDPQGLWERALANPAALADYAVAFHGDAVSKTVEGRGLKELVEISVTGQPRAVLYKLR